MCHEPCTTSYELYWLLGDQRWPTPALDQKFVEVSSCAEYMPLPPMAALIRCAQLPSQCQLTMGASLALQPASGPTVAAVTPSSGRGHPEGRTAAPKPPRTPPPGPQKLGMPRGGGAASESGSGDDECAAARPAAAVDEPAQDWSAAAEWSPVNGANCAPSSRMTSSTLTRL